MRFGIFGRWRRRRVRHVSRPMFGLSRRSMIASPSADATAVRSNSLSSALTRRHRLTPRSRPINRTFAGRQNDESTSPAQLPEVPSRAQIHRDHRRSGPRLSLLRTWRVAARSWWCVSATARSSVVSRGEVTRVLGRCFTVTLVPNWRTRRRKIRADVLLRDQWVRKAAV